MMKKLHNLSMGRKFAIVLIPLIVMIICFDFIHIKHDFVNYEDARRLNNAINIGIEINHLVHEIQKERSISVGFQASKGYIFDDNLLSQREKTDSLFRHLYAELKSNKYNALLTNHVEDIALMKAQLMRLVDLRKEVDNQSLETKEIIHHFSEINKVSLNTFNQLINDTRDKAAAQQVHAIIYLLEAKEYASIERALGTFIFSTSNKSRNVASEFSSLIASQDAYIDAFLTISNQTSKDFYYQTMQGQEINEVINLRALMHNAGKTNVDPKDWYRVITSKINSLKNVEDFMLEDMHNYTETLAANSRRDFFAFLFLDLLISAVTFTLVALIVIGLIKNVAKLEKFTKKVSNGDLSEKIQIDSHDEIGQYANTFNIMLNEINKTQRELSSAKEKAEYLYENIYKQSEVVFENVEQGIFLLDKDLKISSLYSKAVEKIFDNKFIANENFCNFMRPRIIQRDYEALEMFIKHLFNPDMDEDVVNQLNPIEKVKIFISANGVVVNKHLRVSFTRVVNAGEIQSIMVTISDETESVLLQQHMHESEAKKKQETEYLLNILKVEPTILRAFIDDTKTTLKSISEKYEKSAESNLTDLLKYTFRTLHQVKGNAMSIGVELISEKVHQIEDELVGLMDTNVTPEKFLAILYELEEMDQMITHMDRILDKVGEIYKNFEKKKQSSPVEGLEQLLKQSLKTLTPKSAQKIKLSVTSSEEINVSEQQIKSINDIVVQMMRNSISHGIENADERVKKGKSETGNITVSLDQKTYGPLTISYEDDGRGLDLALIKIKAIDSKLIDDEREITDSHVVDLLFNQGFTTSKSVDQLSGRGQGMGLIKSIVEAYGGTYKIDFEKDCFFKITIQLPAAVEHPMEKVA